MDVIEQNPEDLSEALKVAHEWLTNYNTTSNDRPNSLVLWKAHKPFFENIVWGAGSLINLFPGTHYQIDDFRCWHASADDAWCEDWYNVGADFYGSLIEAQVEPVNVRSSEHKSTAPATA